MRRVPERHYVKETPRGHGFAARRFVCTIAMKLPRSAETLGLEVIDLADAERPPMIRIPEYRAKRGLDG